MLVCPHLTGCTDTCLGLINNKNDLVILGNLSQSLIEVWSGHVILKSRNWLNDNSSNIFLLIPSCDDSLSDLLKTSIFLSFVFVFKLYHGVSDLRERSARPVECRHLLNIYSFITARECAH